jgi:hypothetical protein
MKITAAIAIVLALSCGQSRAQSIPGQPMVPLGYCQITATPLASATKLSSCSGGIPAGATMMAVQAETANIRYRDDGVAPTSSIGQLLVSGQNPMLYTGTLSAIQFIAATGSPILDVSFYRQ